MSEDDDILDRFRMDFLSCRNTGLPNNINVMIHSTMRNSLHSPRITVSNIRGHFGQDTFGVSIREREIIGIPNNFTPTEFAAINAWITLNQGVLLEFWHSDEMSSSCGMRMLKKLSRRGI